MGQIGSESIEEKKEGCAEVRCQGQEISEGVVDRRAENE